MVVGGEAAVLWLVGGPHTFSVTMVTALPAQIWSSIPGAGARLNGCQVARHAVTYRRRARDGRAAHGGGESRATWRVLLDEACAHLYVQQRLALCTGSLGGLDKFFFLLWLERNINDFSSCSSFKGPVRKIWPD